MLFILIYCNYIKNKVKQKKIKYTKYKKYLNSQK